jgi:hypothetical protein
MWLTSVRGRWQAGSSRTRWQAARRRRLRPTLEQLEDRTLLASYTVGTVTDLINDIVASNTAGGSSTITLVASTTFQLTVVNNSTDGPTGLPTIAKNDHLTIVGNSDTIEQSTASGTPAFRLFDVAGGARLTLKNVTLQDGLEQGKGVSAEGGAIFSRGTLVLSGVTAQNNIVQGANGANGTKTSPDGKPGQAAAGGAIWSKGPLTLEKSTVIQNNQAIGGNGGNGGTQSTEHGGNGGAGGQCFGRRAVRGRRHSEPQQQHADQQCRPGRSGRPRCPERRRRRRRGGWQRLGRWLAAGPGGHRRRRRQRSRRRARCGGRHGHLEQRHAFRQYRPGGQRR